MLTILTSPRLVPYLILPRVCVFYAVSPGAQCSFIRTIFLGLLEITAAQYASLKNLYFKIGGTTFTLPPNGQIWPRALNTYIGGNSGSIYLIVGNVRLVHNSGSCLFESSDNLVQSVIQSGLPSGLGLDFINGYGFLERFYSVFDTTNKRIGFATTAYTTATTN